MRPLRISANQDGPLLLIEHASLSNILLVTLPSFHIAVSVYWFSPRLNATARFE